MTIYELLQSVSQGENGTLYGENEELALVANDIIGATTGGRGDEKESANSAVDAVGFVEMEQRKAEKWAIEHNRWIPFSNVFDLGLPGPSGSESDTYLSSDGYVYKQNNLLHCSGSIVYTLVRFILHNIIFPDTAYAFVGFTGFQGRGVYPIVRQCYIEDSCPATQNEIDCYMAAIGFKKVGVGKFENDQFLLSDLLPKNALKDNTGDVFIIDAEISLK